MKVIKLELTEDRLIAFGKVIRGYADIDSLDEIEIIMEVERIFKVEIPSVGDVEWMEDKR